MEINEIKKADFLDILFDGRNKAYGAYDLRKTYRRRVIVSLTTMLCVVVALGAILLYTAESKNKAKQVSVMQEIELAQVEEIKNKPPEAAPPPPPPPPPAPKAEPIKLEVTKFVVPKIAPDIEVKKEIKDQDELTNTRIGSFDQKGLKTGAMAPPLEVSGVGGTSFQNVAASAAPAKKDDYEKEFTTVAVEAKYPGDWERFIRRNLNNNIVVDQGAPPGTRYTVVVSFRVDREGNVTEVKAMNDPGYGAAAEAVAAIRKSGKWIPAEQNGQKVISRKRQAITFITPDE